MEKELMKEPAEELETAPVQTPETKKKWKPHLPKSKKGKRC